MKFHPFILIALLICGRAQAQEICHFTHVDIPRNEVRLLELARVVEFRCECLLPRLDDNSQFIAERYQNGKCVSRQWFSLGKYGQQSEGNYKGIISFGWHMDDHKLVGVHDTGYFHQTGFAEMPGFHSSLPNVWSFFKDSRAETRTSNSGLRFDLYPIIGIRGSKEQTINGVTVTGRTGDISSLSQKQLIDLFKNQPDAIIVYLSFGAGLPDLDYDK
jgi:hypothetical protein